MIKGFGLDIADVDRVRAALRKKGFEARVFHSAESKYCRAAGGSLKFQRFAARFAAKEAFIKACGGIFQGLWLKEICVEKGPQGQPRLILSGGTLTAFQKRFRGKIHLTLSHTARWAVAAVVIERNGS